MRVKTRCRRVLTVVAQPNPAGHLGNRGPKAHPVKPTSGRCRVKENPERAPSMGSASLKDRLASGRANHPPRVASRVRPCMPQKHHQKKKPSAAARARAKFDPNPPPVAS